MFAQGSTQKRITIGCSIVLALSGALNPASAYADRESEKASLAQQAQELSEEIEAATNAYQSAEAEVADIEESISQNEERISEIEQQLPEQRERTAASVKSLYMLQQSSAGLLDLILSANSFNEFISTISYIDDIHERNTDEIDKLAALNQELVDTQEELALQHDAAEQARNEAYNALEDARAAKQKVQQRADEIAAQEEKERAEAIAVAQEAKRKAEEEAAAKKQAEEEAQAEAEKAQQEEEEKEKAEEEAAAAIFTTRSGNTAQIEVPEDVTSVSTEPITSNTTPQESSGWAARIDAYLAGSPLAGYGSTFAEAAAQYGVDPRFSPAISCIESSKGAICFRPHNAWGWGNSSWSDWKTAIYDHVAGLASLYGGTLTLEGAKMYCPPTYQEWYSSVLSEMNSI